MYQLGSSLNENTSIVRERVGLFPLFISLSQKLGDQAETNYAPERPQTPFPPLQRGLTSLYSWLCPSITAFYMYVSLDQCSRPAISSTNSNNCCQLLKVSESQPQCSLDIRFKVIWTLGFCLYWNSAPALTDWLWCILIISWLAQIHIIHWNFLIVFSSPAGELQLKSHRWHCKSSDQLR